MKVLLIKDVYKLGRAGDIKKVAAGYGRNYLIPQGYALPATQGAMTQADRIAEKATERRAVLNEELSDIAEVLDGKTIMFPVRAGETGHLYGSVSDDDIITAIQANFKIELEKRQVETEPIRQLGRFQVPIHLTMDLVPKLTVVVHREGEVPGDDEATEESETVVEIKVTENTPEVDAVQESGEEDAEEDNSPEQEPETDK